MEPPPAPLISDPATLAEALQQFEARFRAIFESTAIGIGLLGLDGRILKVNAAVCTISGYSSDELLQRSDQDNVFPEDREIDAELALQLVAGELDAYQVEKRYVRKDGRVIWARLSLSSVRGPDGKPQYLVGMIEDITEQNQIISELQASEARFRTLFTTAAVGIGILGLDRKLIDANPALCEMYGYECGELIGNTSLMVTHPDDYPRASALLQRMLNGELDSFFDERRYIRKNGDAFWAFITMSLVRDDHGQPLYIVGLVNDIDKQKKAQDTLRDSEARFRAMFDNVAIGMAIVSPDRKVISANQTLSRITGYPMEEMIGTDPSSFTHPDDRNIGMEQLRDLIEGRVSSIQLERRYIRKNNSIFWGRVAYSAVPGDDGKPMYLVGSMEDITEEKFSAEKLAAQEKSYRRTLEQRIAERTDELNKANQLLQEKAAQEAVTAERTRLARDLHDAVTQTLFSTTLIADVLPEIWEMNPFEGKLRLEEIRQLTRGALAEMRTLLVELRPNALVEVPLPTLLRQLTEAMAGRSRMSIQLSVDGDRKLPGEVQVGLYRIAQEALNNMVKHGHASQGVVTLRLGETVRLAVADNGIGFDLSDVTADHMGLRIMRERAEAIGATLSIYTEPGDGTQISITWS